MMKLLILVNYGMMAIALRILAEIFIEFTPGEGFLAQLAILITLILIGKGDGK